MLAGPPLRTIAGSRVLIVGLGAIGMATARRMAALGARVDGDPPRAPTAAPGFVDAVVGRRTRCSICCPRPTWSCWPRRRRARRAA